MPVAFTSLFLIYHTQRLFVHMDVREFFKCVLLFFPSCCKMGMADMGRWGGGRETATREQAEGATDSPRGDEEIKIHLTLKNLLYKTNYFSEESFHHCIAVGPIAIT